MTNIKFLTFQNSLSGFSQLQDLNPIEELQWNNLICF